MAAPFDAAARRQREFGKPLEIGADVWVGGGALIYGRRA
jgi:maltose O-acetyltransferase